MIPTSDVGGSLQEPRLTVSAERLACLIRHWEWTDQARARFERELADGWAYDEDPAADHPFGAFYHWCALLSSFIDALAVDGLLPSCQGARIRADLHASCPDLQVGRHLLLAIPSAIEARPLIVDFLHDDERLDRLRWMHKVFGDVIGREGTADGDERVAAPP